MPIYPWKCEECGERTEVINRISESDKPPEQSCESCRKTNWTKAPPTGTSLNKGASWGRGKGHW